MMLFNSASVDGCVSTANFSETTLPGPKCKTSSYETIQYNFPISNCMFKHIISYLGNSQYNPYFFKFLYDFISSFQFKMRSSFIFWSVFTIFIVKIVKCGKTNYLTKVLNGESNHSQSEHIYENPIESKPLTIVYITLATAGI